MVCMIAKQKELIYDMYAAKQYWGLSYYHITMLWAPLVWASDRSPQKCECSRSPSSCQQIVRVLPNHKK